MSDIIIINFFYLILVPHEVIYITLLIIFLVVIICNLEPFLSLIQLVGTHPKVAHLAPVCQTLLPVLARSDPAPCMVWPPSCSASTAPPAGSLQATSLYPLWPVHHRPLHRALHPSVPLLPCQAMGSSLLQ